MFLSLDLVIFQEVEYGYIGYKLVDIYIVRRRASSCSALRCGAQSACMCLRSVPVSLDSEIKYMQTGSHSYLSSDMFSLVGTKLYIFDVTNLKSPLLTNLVLTFVSGCACIYIYIIATCFFAGNSFRYQSYMYLRQWFLVNRNVLYPRQVCTRVQRERICRTLLVFGRIIAY